MLKYNLNACIDIIGFSLLGHAVQMAKDSNIALVLNINVILLPRIRLRLPGKVFSQLMPEEIMLLVS